jgi:hypothetical protein
MGGIGNCGRSGGEDDVVKRRIPISLAGFTVGLDPEHRLVEITRLNNAVKL